MGYNILEFGMAIKKLSCSRSIIYYSLSYKKWPLLCVVIHLDFKLSYIVLGHTLKSQVVSGCQYMASNDAYTD